MSSLLPLLSRHVHVTEVTLKSPTVHLIRTEEGGFNVSTLGKKQEENETKTPELEHGTPGSAGAPLATERTTPRRKRNLNSVYIRHFAIDDAVIVVRGARTESSKCVN